MLDDATSLYHVHSDDSVLSSENSDNGSGSDEASGSDDGDLEHTLTQADFTTQLSNISTLSQDRRNIIERSVTHYECMDKGITRMPQFYKADEFLKCLSQFTMENETLKDLGKLSTDLDSNNRDVKYEIIIENQRGTTMFGSKLFSKQSVLYPLDPPKYQTLTGQNLTNLSMYPEPAHNWKWCWKHWHVMMINDVDEEGWIYSSIRFGSYHWSGIGKFGNFVRRRIWVRMVEPIDKINPADDEVSSESSESDDIGVGNKINHKTLHVLPNYKDIHDKYTKTSHRRSYFGKKCSSLNPIHTHKAKQTVVTNAISQSKRINASRKDKLLSNKHQTIPTNFKNDNIPSVESNSNLESDSDDSSIVSFSAETLEELSPHGSQLYPQIPSLESLEELSEDEQLINETFEKLQSCTIDRQRISTIINALMSYENSTVDFLVDDYKSASDKSVSWLGKFICQIHFHESKELFLNKLQLLLNSQQLHTQKRDKLIRIYDIFKEMIGGQSHAFEKNDI